MDTTTPLKKLRESIIPVWGIRWDSQVIRRLSSGRIDEILWSLRNPKLPMKHYNRICSLWRAGLKRDATFPIDWGNWRALIERFNLDDALPLGGLSVVDTCVETGWEEPTHLALSDAASFSAVATCRKLPFISHHLWKSDGIVFRHARRGHFGHKRGFAGRRTSSITT